MESDEELVRRINNGSTEAYRELVERHYDRMIRVATPFLKKTKDDVKGEEDVKDVVQGVYANLPIKIKSFKGDSLFTTWLSTVTINSCKDLKKKEGRSNKTFYSDSKIELQADEGNDRIKDNNWLLTQIALLPSPLKETAFLVYIEGYTHAEAAKLQGVKESTISWRISEIKRILRAKQENKE